MGWSERISQSEWAETQHIGNREITLGVNFFWGGFSGLYKCFEKDLRERNLKRTTEILQYKDFLMNRISGGRRPLNRFTGVSFCIAVYGENVFGPHGIFFPCNTTRGHWKNRYTGRAPYKVPIKHLCFIPAHFQLLIGQRLLEIINSWFGIM